MFLSLSLSQYIRNKSSNVEFNHQSFKSSSFWNTSLSFQFYVFAIYVAIFPCITRSACSDGSVFILTIASSSHETI